MKAKSCPSWSCCCCCCCSLLGPQKENKSLSTTKIILQSRTEQITTLYSEYILRTINTSRRVIFLSFDVLKEPYFHFLKCLVGLLYDARACCLQESTINTAALRYREHSAAQRSTAQHSAISPHMSGGILYSTLSFQNERRHGNLPGLHTKKKNYSQRTAVVWCAKDLPFSTLSISIHEVT